jgi:hypothetical protein
LRPHTVFFLNNLDLPLLSAEYFLFMELGRGGLDLLLLLAAFASCMVRSVRVTDLGGTFTA